MLLKAKCLSAHCRPSHMQAVGFIRHPLPPTSVAFVFILIS